MHFWRIPYCVLLRVSIFAQLLHSYTWKNWEFQPSYECIDGMACVCWEFQPSYECIDGMARVCYDYAS